MDNGWIKLHRSFLDWEWYTCPNTARLFLHCLLMANHKDSKHRGEPVLRGSFLTSLEKLSVQTGLSIKSIRTSLKHLESTGEIGTERARKGTRLTICKYDTYQNIELGMGTEKGNERATKGQEKGKKRATNKNDKKEKNDKKVFSKPLVDDIRHYCKERNNTVDPVKFWDFYESKGWMVGKNKMKDWKAAVRTWESKEPKKDISQWRPS